MKSLYKIATTLIVLTSIGASLPAVAEIYRWVDEDGVTHYGDRPAANAEHVRIRDGKPVSPTKEEKAETVELAALREEQCEMAQSRYKEYSSSDRLIEQDDFGKKRELSPDERLAAIAKAKSDVDAYCN